jgi:hypothetical protein
MTDDHPKEDGTNLGASKEERLTAGTDVLSLQDYLPARHNIHS